MKAETSGPEWGQAYAYDGFGNLTQKTVTKGTATTLSTSYDAGTNRQAGVGYDANGNVVSRNGASYAWNVENRMEGWVYDPWGRRVLKGDANGTYTLNEWSVAGQLRARVEHDAGTGGTTTMGRSYFGGRLIQVGMFPQATDRLGSLQASWGGSSWGTRWSYYPYGEERQSGAPEGSERFATYTRDSAVDGVNYAGQRYYSPGLGRFFSPDTVMGNPANPQSWNKYGYVYGDPINFNDRTGRWGEWVGDTLFECHGSEYTWCEASRLGFRDMMISQPHADENGRI